MSNKSLIERIELCLSLLSRREILPRVAASSFLLNGRTLEALPYDLILQMEDIGGDLEIANWEDEDEYPPYLGDVIRRAEEWLAKVSTLGYSSDDWAAEA